MQSISQLRKAGSTGYPKFMYPDPMILGNIPPVIVENVEAQKKLGAGWLDDYRHQDYPRTMYKEGVAKIQPQITKPNGDIVREEAVIHVTKIVHSAEEERALGRGWSRVPPDPYDTETGEPELVKDTSQLEAENESLRKSVEEAKAKAADHESLKRKLAALEAQIAKKHANSEA